MLERAAPAREAPLQLRGRVRSARPVLEAFALERALADRSGPTAAELAGERMERSAAGRPAAGVTFVICVSFVRQNRAARLTAGGALSW